MPASCGSRWLDQIITLEVTTADSCVSSDIKILTSDIMNHFLLVSLSKGKVWKLTTELNLEDVSHNGTQQYIDVAPSRRRHLKLLELINKMLYFNIVY